MNVSRLINRPCTLKLRSPSAETDDYGNEVKPLTEVESVWEIQELTRRAQEPDAQLADTLWNGYFLVGTEINGGDSVVDDELGEFELIGDPWPVRNPRTQIESHLEVKVRRTAGPEDAS